MDAFALIIAIVYLALAAVGAVLMIAGARDLRNGASVFGWVLVAVGALLVLAVVASIVSSLVVPH